jgi:hypothetical protein
MYPINSMLKTVIYIVFFLASTPGLSAEFATIASVNAMSSKSAGFGQSIAVTYGAFGATISGEIKKYSDKRISAIYIGGTNLEYSIDLGLTSEGMSTRLGAHIPLFQYTDIPYVDRVYLTIGIEKFFSHNEYTSALVGIRLLFYDI